MDHTFVCVAALRHHTSLKCRIGPFIPMYSLVKGQLSTKNMPAILLFSFLFFFTLLTVRAQEFDSTQIPVERVVDFKTLDLLLNIQPKKGQVSGVATYRWEALRPRIDSLFLHAKSMEVTHVLVNGRMCRHRLDDQGLHIFPHPPVKGDNEMVVEYVATPKQGLYFNGWNGKGRKQIWSQGQGIKNRHWIPCFDLQHDKLITSVEIAFDREFTVISNGALISKEREGSKIRWKYAMEQPQPSYLIALIIGKYDLVQQRGPNGITIENYYYPDQPRQAEPTFAETDQLLAYLEEEIGVPYPWGVYRQAPVEYFLYGAMENTAAVVLNDRYLVDERARIDKNYVYVNAHEMAHHWFGNWLTARTGHDHWLQEGFATYYGALGEKAMLGEEVCEYRRWHDYQLVTTKESSQVYPLQHNAAGSLTHYQKGRLVLEMLREEVGTAVFRRAISGYVRHNAYGLVDSDELLDAFSDMSGRSLGWFWDQWVYNPGIPTLRVDVDTVRSEGWTTYGFTLYQHDSIYRFGWNWEVVLERGGRISGREAVDQAEHRWEVQIPEGQEIRYVLFDPDGIVLKHFVYPYSREQLLAIAQDTLHYFSRAQALKDLQRFPGIGEVQDMLAILPDDTGLRKLWAPNMIHYPEAKTVAQAWFSSGSVADYETAWYLMGEHPADETALYMKLMANGSPGFLEVMMDDLLTENGLDMAHILESDYAGNNGNNLAVRRAMWRYALLDDANGLKQLLEYGSGKYNRQTRENAWEALRKIEFKDKRWRKQLEEASTHYNYRFRTSAKRFLQYLQEVDQ